MDLEIFTEDGYPTEEFLESIKDWQWHDGYDELLQWAMEGHIYPNYWARDVHANKIIWDISTGGWSGNEDIIGALQENMVFWASCWVQSRRGGHYVFECRPLEKPATPLASQAPSRAGRE